MKKLILTFILAIVSVAVYSQTSPGLIYGQVPTAAQWNSYFSNKMDWPGSSGAAGNVWTSNGHGFYSAPPAAAGSLAGGNTNSVPYQNGPNSTTFLGSGTGFFVENGSAPFWLGFGTSVNNPGTGTAESLLQVQTITGTSHTFATADLFQKTRRSNSGTSMTDTFPALGSTGISNGTQINVTNVDATATDTITAGAGTTIAGSSSFIVQPGRDVWWAYDAVNTTWRVIANTSTSILFTGTPATASQIWCGYSVSGMAQACSIGTGLTLSGTTLSNTTATTTQSANTVYAGPSSGSAATPTFRALVANDITAVNTQTYDSNSTLPASTAMVQAAIAASESTLPLNLGSTGGGTYSFDGTGSGLSIVYNTTSGAISSILSIASGGSGFKVGDMVKITGTTGNNDAIVWVTSVSGGAVTAVQILYGGTGYSGVGAGGNGAAYSSLLIYSLTLTGTLTSNATFILSYGTYLTESSHGIVNNNTTGSFTTTFYQGNSSDGTTGSGVVIPQGTNNSAGALIQQDGITGVWCEGGSCITGITQTGTLTATGHVQFSGLQTTGTIANAACLDSSGNLIANSGTNCYSSAAGGNVTRNYAVKTANYTAAVNDAILADTSGGAFTITLPSSPAQFSTVCITDAAGTFGTNILTIAGNGSNIMSSSANMTASTSYIGFCLVYYTSGTGWRIQ